MKSTLFLLSLVAAAFSSPFSRQSNDSPVAGALYFLADDPNGASLVIHDIRKNGTVQYSNYVSTGGKGSIGIVSPVLGHDPLMSQGSVIVSGNRLYTVNAGSNTIAIFSIDPKRPSRLTMIGKPVNSGGTFPLAVAAHPKNGNVCALNSGSVSSVLCFRNTPSGLSSIKGSFQSLNKILNVTLTDPPLVPMDSFAHILFSEDGSRLYVTFRGSDPGRPGEIVIFNVHLDGSLSFSKRIFSPAAAWATFAMTLVPSNPDLIVIATPSVGYVVYDVTHSNRSNIPPVPNQQAICWSDYSSKTGTYFLADAISGVITEVEVDPNTLDGTIVKQYQQSATGALDEEILNIDGTDYLYVLIADSMSLGVLKLAPNGGSANYQTASFENVKDQNGNTLATTAVVQGMAGYVIDY